VIDWVVRRTVEKENTGIRWRVTSSLEDLDVADHLVLLSSTKTHAQAKVDRLNAVGKRTGLKINVKKTKVLRLDVKNQEPIVLGEGIIDDVDTFAYLGATVSTKRLHGKEIGVRLGKARVAFSKLNKIWGEGEELSVKQKYQGAKFQIKRDCYSAIWLRDLGHA